MNYLRRWTTAAALAGVATAALVLVPSCGDEQTAAEQLGHAQQLHKRASRD